MALDIVSYLMGQAKGGGGALTELVPQYQGFSYGYVNGGDGTFIAGGSNETYLNVLEVEAGKTYVFFVGTVAGNRFRPTFLSGKTYADIAPYITQPGSTNFPGQYLRAAGDPGYGPWYERIYFTPSTDGVICIGTSNDGTTQSRVVFLVQA